MENKQVTKNDSIVVQNSDEELLIETPLDLVKKIIPLAKKWHELTFKNKDLSSLFSNIIVSSQGKLLPEVEKITDFKTETQELIKAGDALAEIINYSSKGFELTDLTEEEEISGQEYNEEHLIFAEILRISDTEIRIHIPTPTEVK